MMESNCLRGVGLVTCHFHNSSFAQLAIHSGFEHMFLDIFLYSLTHVYVMVVIWDVIIVVGYQLVKGEWIKCKGKKCTACLWLRKSI